MSDGLGRARGPAAFLSPHTTKGSNIRVTAIRGRLKNDHRSQHDIVGLVFPQWCEMVAPKRGGTCPTSTSARLGDSVESVMRDRVVDRKPWGPAAAAAAAVRCVSRGRRVEEEDECHGAAGTRCLL